MIVQAHLAGASLTLCHQPPISRVKYLILHRAKYIGLRVRVDVQIWSRLLQLRQTGFSDLGPFEVE